jgi:hypothetical protein
VLPAGETICGGRMKIFISYSASDASEARSMASTLQARGYNVFFDKETLGGGQSYDGKIERAFIPPIYSSFF